ncbi:MAG TPA: isocitrate dehydrogenase (NADP(+)) [Candidatus Thermoplasmatota archaeon]|nr:isocitrate dehydrogenase (NADP(+)) [Candidatus Thermoplasmatota archaeon]
MAFPSPPSGQRITFRGGALTVPDDPVIPVIVGDGTGPDIMNAALPVLQAAVAKAYGGRRRLAWYEVPAGMTALETVGELLPARTLEALQTYVVGIKGPMTTPIGTGFRSVNVALRQELDLYACVRPVYGLPGVPAPSRNPMGLDIVIFRENIEDVYAGVEFPAGSPEAARLEEFLVRDLGVKRSKIQPGSALGIKPMSAFNSKRLIRKAIQYAIDKKRTSVTLVHKGNVMKFTEGAFRDWGYEVARTEFPDVTVTEQELVERHGGNAPPGKIVIKDRIADNMLQQIQTRPTEYDVVATPNLNGDYLSDAAAGYVGGLGFAPGGNIGDGPAVFEATHGSAPKYAGQDKVNPSSVILSGVMMLEYLGWDEAARLTKDAIRKTIHAGVVTYDLAREMNLAPVKCSEFGKAVIGNL